MTSLSRLYRSPSQSEPSLEDCAFRVETVVSLQYHVIPDPPANISGVSTRPLDGTDMGQCRNHGHLVLGQVSSP